MSGDRAFLPFDAYEYVTVTFDTANVDVKIPHSLYPEDPYDVVYIPVRKSGDCTISDQPLTVDSAPPIPWTRGYIVLRSNVAPANVTLLLAVKRQGERAT